MVGLKVLSALDLARTQLYHFKAIVIAGMGLFADAYDSFKSQRGKIQPSVVSMTVATALIGTVFGKVVFGYCGDKFGRRRVYGFALLIMIFSPIGCGFSICRTRKCVIASPCLFRFMLGVGIGGDYPISATIMSEFTNKATRGSFIAVVFSMQGFGILTSSVVTMLLCGIFNHASDPKNKITRTPDEADLLWRLILMFGAIPAAMTFYWRMMMPETARYTDLVEQNLRQAVKDMEGVLDIPMTEITEEHDLVPMCNLFFKFLHHATNLRNFFKRIFLASWTRSLCLCFFLVPRGCCFYSSNIFQSHVYHDLLRDPHKMNAYQQAYDVAKLQAIIAVCSTIPGYWATVFFIDRIGRVKIQMIGFLGMGIWFLILYGLTFFFSNFGPNTTTFIVPAELFPARFRSNLSWDLWCLGFLWASQSQTEEDVDKGYQKGIGMTNSLVILGGISLLGMILTYFFTRETMGRSLEENEVDYGASNQTIMACFTGADQTSPEHHQNPSSHVRPSISSTASSSTTNSTVAIDQRRNYYFCFHFVLNFNQQIDVVLVSLEVKSISRTQLYHFKAIIIAGMGLFTDAYDLFCITPVMKLIGRIYYEDQDIDESERGVIPPSVVSITVATALIGTVFGNLVFGYCGDRFGRRRVYGVALLIRIFSSIGCGFSICRTRKCVIASLCFFRFMLGIGIGGDYPISATIMSEFANKATRGSFIAAVFSMQGFGILTSSAVTMLLCGIFNHASESKNKVTQTPDEADLLWRLILMFGAIPAAMTFYWRMLMPETAREVFWRHGQDLFACASSWFLVDVVFYSSNLFQSHVYSDLLRDPIKLNAYQQAYDVAKLQAIIAVCSTIPGYWATVFFIDRIGRVKIQMMGFLVMGICMFAIGIPYYQYWNDHTNAGFLILYGLTFFFSNFGPNTTTFIVPAELFPARFRSTCHGISGAAGKIGAIIGSVGFLWASQSQNEKDVEKGYQKGIGMTNSLVILGGISLLGMILTYFFTRDMGRSLEENEVENGTSFMACFSGADQTSPEHHQHPSSHVRPSISSTASSSTTNSIVY
ncbi:hypothetical protein MKX01_020175 [Papaver californicum]|nr:hypothetical protein MKX01_020175 [Papaver californicum]